MTAHQALVETRLILNDEENWSPKGWGTGKMCLVNALCHATGRLPIKPRLVPGYAVLADLTRGQYVGGFNDTHTHAEVIALLDQAIALTAPEREMALV